MLKLFNHVLNIFANIFCCFYIERKNKTISMAVFYCELYWCFGVKRIGFSNWYFRVDFLTDTSQQVSHLWHHFMYGLQNLILFFLSSNSRRYFLPSCRCHLGQQHYHPFWVVLFPLNGYCHIFCKQLAKWNIINDKI